jgi:nudix-type nucleoside diphosphatase (YffH/AdpP family)
MVEGNVRILSSEVLANDWGVLRKTVLDFRRSDGTWQTLTRETYDRGHGAAILLFDPRRNTVLLTRQFRFPAFVNGHEAPLIEVVAGLLEGDDPETAIRREAEEEAGVRVSNPRKVFELFMSPGSVTEKLVLYIADYSPEDCISAGGGHFSEGEDIAVLELPLDTAMTMVARGEILDAKTVILLQYAALAENAATQAAPNS